MDFYFHNRFLNFNSYFRKAMMIIKFCLNFFILATGLFFLTLNLKELRFIGLFLILFLTVLFFRNGAKEDVRFQVHKNKRVNLDNYLDKKTRNFFLEILTHAEIMKVNDAEAFLFQELIKTKDIKNLLLRLNINFKEIQNFITCESGLDKIDYLKAYQPFLISAFFLARNLNYSKIHILFIFYFLVSHEKFKSLREKFDLKNEYLLSAVLMEVFNENLKFNFKPDRSLTLFHKKFTKKSLLNKSLTSQPTDLLDSYGIDLTYLARHGSGSFLIGHSAEIERLINVLKLRKNVILLGEEGSDLETLVTHLAWLIDNELVPEEILDYRLVKLDLSFLYSENKDKFLPLLTKIIEEILNSNYIILYFPNFDQIILESQADIFQLLREVLRYNEIPVIATMSLLGYERALAQINLNSFFEKIEIKEITEEEAVYFLTLKSILWEKTKNIIITPQSICTAVSLAHQFIKTKTLPQSAEDLILEGLDLAQKFNAKVLTKEIIQEIAFEKTKIPVKELIFEEKEKLLNLENLLHQKIIDQDYAIKEIARVLKIYHAGLQKKKGPIGAFLCVGPTGVGKTETAKALAKIFYGSENAMVRLDMVEFQNSDDLDKLIGSKDGQILGRLTEPIRQNPYSLVLLDEFEKTHPIILKIFLPIFDEGLIKDALDREVDFSHSLFICTSNAYSEFIKESLEKGIEFGKIIDELRSKLTQFFSVELLNRFDQIIIYKPLGNQELIQITKLLLKDLEAELLLKHGVDLKVSESAVEELVRLGVDSVFGARSLRRKIDEILKSEIANLILENKISRGQKIFIDFKEKFYFHIN